MDTKEAELILSGKYEIERIDVDEQYCTAFIILRHKNTRNTRRIDIGDFDIQYMSFMLALYTVGKSL